MNQTAIFWPMLAHVALVYGVYALVSRRRIAAIAAGKARSSQFRENLVEPEESLFAHNNLRNQFELPTLFHPLCIALYVTGGVGVLVVVLAWLFVASRYVHGWVHVSTNRIRHRRPLFILGYGAMALMWIVLAFQIAGIV